jgi:DNA-binding transcriptional regulator YiaG
MPFDISRAMTPKRIITLRKRLGLTQQALADRIGAQQHTVARWETAQHEPRGANLKALRELEKEAKTMKTKRK